MELFFAVVRVLVFLGVEADFAGAGVSVRTLPQGSLGCLASGIFFNESL